MRLAVASDWAGFRSNLALHYRVIRGLTGVLGQAEKKFLLKINTVYYPSAVTLAARAT